MIIKPFNINNLKKNLSNLFLFYGENEGLKDEVIKKFFLDGFDGEIIKYDENQVLENKNEFYELCFNESLFSTKKIIIISRLTSKLYDIIVDLSERVITNKKIIINSGILEKKSKIRLLFEKHEKLVCIAFYKDNNTSLHKIASEFFRSNKIAISNENINLIIEKCSGDRKNLQNELNKILNYCFQKNKINREELIKLINLYEDYNYFELIDSCLSKNHKIVCKIINSKTFNNNDAIIILRSFSLRLKRLIELKKIYKEIGNSKDAIENYRPPIFWKDKDIVEKQIEVWSTKDVFMLLDEVTSLEINYKKNSNFNNNLVFDLILNTSASN